MKQEKTYSAELMKVGTDNENIILEWLKTEARSVIDFRDFRLAQRIDVDFGIETIDGVIVLAEIKSDKHIKDAGNLCFECNRINHSGHYFYLGWGWRSPAQKLIVRNPISGDTYVFTLAQLRAVIANYIGEMGKNLNILIVETDKTKTTFNYLIPMGKLANFYSKYHIAP